MLFAELAIEFSEYFFQSGSERPEEEGVAMATCAITLLAIPGAFAIIVLQNF